MPTSRVIFWDVDTQYDFMKADGKLYVPDAEQLIPNLRKLTDYAHGHDIRIVASADDHVREHTEISATPDWKATFPPHCLRGTPGQRKIAETALRDPLVIEPEPQDGTALATRIRNHRGDMLFHKHRFDVFSNPNVLPVLDALNPHDIVLYGVALDVCDKYAIEGLLQHRPQCRPVLVGTNSATGFMEMAVRNGIRRRALSLVNGAFSERFAGIVGACGKECIRLDVPLGAAVEPDMLRDALKRTPVDAVTCVHSETSTGVLQDVAGYAEVVREFDDVLLLVDCVTSMVGSPVETDGWKLDFAFTGSQKALALPPGLALGVASERMVERAKTLEERGAYFDLNSFLTATTKFQPTNTPAISLLYALEVQLGRIEREGGIEARWKRHDAMRRRVETWAPEHGIKFLPREGRHSWTVSCLTLPDGKHSKDVVGALKQQGWTIGAGYGALKDTTIRIGHMGDHTVAALDELLPLIARALE